jgi:hypothetical protein
MGLTHEKPVQKTAGSASRRYLKRKGIYGILNRGHTGIDSLCVRNAGGIRSRSRFYPTLLMPIATYYVL